MKYKDYKDKLEFVRKDTDGKDLYRIRGSKVLYKVSGRCKFCNNEVLCQSNASGIYCSKKCRAMGTTGLKYYGDGRRFKSLDQRKAISNTLKGRKLTKEHKENIRKSVTGELSPMWRGGVTKKDIPLYNTYSGRLTIDEGCRESKEGYLEVVCTYCGDLFIPKRRDVVNRISVLEGKSGSRGECRLYCSDGCKDACPVFGKSYLTLMIEDALRSGRYVPLNQERSPEVRKMVLERDGYACVECGASREEVSLHCHHIKAFALEPMLSGDMDNCVTLCEECHKYEHRAGGGNSYADIREERVRRCNGV